MLDRERSQLLAPLDEENVGANHERASSRPHQICEDGFEIALGARLEDMELQPESVSRLPGVSHQPLGNRRSA